MAEVVLREEQAVIPWLAQALQNNLRLDGDARDWLFLNQEWRFVMPDRRGRKSDILAVHSTTGQLGIIEAKDDRAKRPEAEDQLETYAAAFASDAAELAELFTAQLNVLAKLYGSPAAERLQVSTRPAQRFFAYPGGLFATKLKVVSS